MHVRCSCAPPPVKQIQQLPQKINHRTRRPRLRSQNNLVSPQNRGRNSQAPANHGRMIQKAKRCVRPISRNISHNNNACTRATLHDQIQDQIRTCAKNVANVF